MTKPSVVTSRASQILVCCCTNPSSKCLELTIRLGCARKYAGVNGSLYAGITNDVTRRYAAHVRGRGARFTRAHPPIALVGSREYPDKSAAAKAMLGPTLDKGNYQKTMDAPVTVIIARDLDFHDKLPYLFPHTDAKAWFEGPRENREKPALRNMALQAAYLILAARALGLDAGPMSGFDNAKVNQAFFAGTQIKSDILVNLGRGDPASFFPRSPRLPFDEAARIA